ncbi:MAG: efflux RND transporter periplasmic adaptor subunit [Deltaproteobacteria bacterium]|nr:efflux RND transporter periplasmic adaptor subunit [Deltaproteobacteria bacterium]
MKKAFIAVFIAAVLIFSVLYFRQPSPIQESAPPQKTSQSPAVSALGKVEPRGGVIRVGTPQEVGVPIIQNVYVKEGDRVRKGQTIAVLKSRERLQAGVEESRKRLETARVKLDIAKFRLTSPDIAAKECTVEKLRIEQEQAEKDYNRMRSLHDVKLISQADFDRYHTNREVKMQELNCDKRELENMFIDRRLGMDLAAAEMAEAQAALVRAEAELNLTYIASPMDGIVLKVYAHNGEAVDADKGILDLGNTDQMYVSAEVYSTDVPRLKIGQRATVRLERSDVKLTGVVDEIGLYVRKNEIVTADPASSLDERVVEVKIRLDEGKQVAGLTNMNVTCIIHP